LIIFPQQAEPRGTREEGMVNDGTQVVGRLRRAWPRLAAAIIATAALALLAACSGSPSSAGSESPSTGEPASRPVANVQKALSFSRCVRVHDVPNYPDPGSNGQVAKETAQQLGVSNSQLQAALNACEHLLPNTGNIDDNPASLHRWWNQMQRFAQCMHTRGVPAWPGPSPYPQDPARPTFNLHAAGIGFHQGAQPGNIVNSPQIQAKVRQCESMVHQNFSGYFN
jgi:hypothetical protein